MVNLVNPAISLFCLEMSLDEHHPLRHKMDQNLLFEPDFALQLVNKCGIAKVAEMVYAGLDESESEQILQVMVEALGYVEVAKRLDHYRQIARQEEEYRREQEEQRAAEREEYYRQSNYEFVQNILNPPQEPQPVRHRLGLWDMVDRAFAIGIGYTATRKFLDK